MPDETRGERRSQVADALDAATAAGAAVARWTPQQTIQVLCLLLLAFLCAVFAAQLWLAREQMAGIARENRETRDTMMRENNAQIELGRIACEQGRERAERAAEAREARWFAFQAQENEKFRREVVAAIKGRGP
jgi:hypothetical protein